MKRDGTDNSTAQDAPPARRRATGPTPDHCRRCRYPLIGLAEETPCPECGYLIRQVGPHRLVGTNVRMAVGSVCIAFFMFVVVFAGVWPAVVLIPFLGLLAVIFGELEARARRRIDLPMSRVTIVTSVLGWLMFLPPVLLLVAFFVW